MAPVVRSSGVQSKRYHVLCPICLDVFTEPITTPCGHNYCKSCITTYWDNDWVCQCPLCTKLFHTRPDVSVNTLISEMADQYRRSQQQQRHAAKPDEVSCDVCTGEAPGGTKLKALKTCLVCLTSFCEAHLERHQSVAALRRHKLVEPVRNLEDVLCQRHGRPLELFCRTDRAAVCQACAEQDHERHELVSLEEECEGKRAELRRSEADVQRAIQEKQVNIRELNCSVEQAEGFIAELRTEISELKKRSSRLKQLSCTEDHLHLLQNFTSMVNAPPPPPPSLPLPLPPPPANAKGLPRAKVSDERFSYDVATVRTAVAQLEKTVRREIEKLRGAELRRNMELWS